MNIFFGTSEIGGKFTGLAQGDFFYGPYTGLCAFGESAIHPITNGTFFPSHAYGASGVRVFFP